MPFATAPALLIGIGARILLDKYNRSDGPFIKDFILMGAWQGVALHYATKASGTSGLGILIAFGIAIKLFIEFNLFSDVTRSITTIFGVALGVFITDFLAQYFDRPPLTSERRRKKPVTTTKTSQKAAEKRRERPVPPPLPLSTQEGSIITSGDITDLHTLATTSLHISDITSVDSASEKLGPTSSMTPLERDIHVLRTRAALADSERRRLKEERKWAISQGNLARASQMKWEVKRYSALMETFNREADLKTLEASLSQSLSSSNGNSSQIKASKRGGTTSTTPKDRSPKSRRDPIVQGNGQHTDGHSASKMPSRSSNTKPSNLRTING